MIDIQPEPTIPHPLRFICRGKHGCGTPLMERDLNLHRHWHAMHGDPVGLDMSGANDPGPMPPRADQ